MLELEYCHKIADEAYLLTHYKACILDT